MNYLDFLDFLIVMLFFFLLCVYVYIQQYYFFLKVKFIRKELDCKDISKYKKNIILMRLI